MSRADDELDKFLRDELTRMTAPFTRMSLDIDTGGDKPVRVWYARLNEKGVEIVRNFYRGDYAALEGQTAGHLENEGSPIAEFREVLRILMNEAGARADDIKTWTSLRTEMRYLMLAIEVSYTIICGLEMHPKATIRFENFEKVK